MNFQEGAFWYLLVGVSMLIGMIPKGQSKYYAKLKKPKWAPRPMVYGVVWTILYGLMATAALLYQRDLPADHWRAGETAFMVFWAISTTFSPIFFILKQLTLATIVCIASFGTGIWVTVEFFQRTYLAGSLFVPTVAWTGFASILSVVMWYQNKNISQKNDIEKPKKEKKKSKKATLST